jgi:hypothetical protein
MSLINDALKKAARQRAEEQADLGPLMPGGGASRARQRGPMGKQAMVLIGAAAVALVVVSVVVTGAFFSGRPEARPAAPAPVAAPAAANPPAQAAVQAPAVVAVTVPRIVAPAPTAAPVPTAAPLIVAAPVPTAAPIPTSAPVAAAQPPPAQAEPAPAAAPPAALAPAPAAAPESREERVQAYIDGLHVTGARSAGADSKALVDGHVFKLGDVLDKALGLRLTGVDPDHLTFVDAAGGTYVKPY